MTILVVVLIAVAGLVAALAVRSRSRRARKVCHQSAVEPSAEDITVNLRVVAAEIDSRVFVVDGVIVDACASMGEVGWPVTLRFDRPEAALLDAHACALVTRWATKDQIVRFRISGDEPRRLSVAYGASSLEFEHTQLPTAPS